MFNQNLSKKEDEVMNAVFTLAGGKERMLVSPYEILSLLPPRAGFDEDNVDRTLRALELDGYFELISTDRKGERAYVFHMKEPGLAYKREDKRRKRLLLARVAVTIALAVLSAVIGVVLKHLLS